MKIKAEVISAINGHPAQTTCPHCGHKGTFEVIGQDLLIQNRYWCGQRRCPDPSCRGHLFVVSDGKSPLFQYPPTEVPFNKQDIPLSILKTLEEAITCHSQSCFVASAMMIRRTLEEICEERGATGKDLKLGVHDLKSRVLLPHELFEAMDELRLLGNDAAHVEAKSFSQITKAEVDVAIEFTIELLKALYQYAGLLGKMRGLKKQTP